MKIAFGTGAYKLGESTDFSAQRMVNCYVEVAAPGAEVPVYVRQRFGITAQDNLSNSRFRGGGKVRDSLYCVYGTQAYRIEENGTFYAIPGAVVPGSGPVTITGDETDIAFLADRTIYYWWHGSVFNTVTDPDVPQTDWLAVMDGYYIGSSADTGQFYISTNRDGRQWDALDFASAEKYPDNIVTGIVDHGELILFGTDSGEIWYNSGNADFPLDKVPSGHFEVGCLAVRGPAKLDNTVYFPGSDGIVYKLNGYVPERVSTHAIEARIRAATDRDFKGMAWTERGHKFYSLTCSEFTLVYDASTQLWHERQSYGYDYWVPNFIVNAYDRWYAGSSVSGKFGYLDESTVTDWGDPLRSSATCQLISDENKRITHSRLELMFESGVGDLVEPDPQVMLRFSDDRGRTWSSEKWRGMGGQGDYRTRTVWNRLGQSRGRIYEYAITSKVRRTLIGASLEAESGGN